MVDRFPMIKGNTVEFDARTLLLEQLQRCVPDRPFTPMVRNISQYQDVVSSVDNTELNLSEVSPDKLFFWSDTHFRHKNIIKYCDRPFVDVDHMTSTLVRNYTDTVPDDGVVVWVGDVAMGNDIDGINALLQALPGYKVLVVGNHDFHSKHKSPFAYAFDEIHLVKTLNNFIISHHPLLEVPDGWYNIHGHVHNNSTTHPRHINVSVEVVDYRPKPFAEIQRIIC